jgi:predicted small metal-binding protein
MKTFSCSDLGNYCNEVLTAQTEERLADMAALHLRDAHGIFSMPQEKIAEIKNLFTHTSTTDAAFVVDRIFETYGCDSDPDCTWRYIAEAEGILTGRKNVHERELKAA